MNKFPGILRPKSQFRTVEIEDGLTRSMTGASITQAEQNTRLATFRHMVGIHSTKELAVSVQNERGELASDFSHNNLHFDGRAAPNLGIYNRVCHREAAAKRGFKFASITINSCLGIQVIVAAALTAMGAANTSHMSITIFGAINTIIAGILTYLKGSGLPNRIRWYENEWKKVREYIEQRERDFSRPNCPLDVNQVVQVVEAMYEEVKADIQNNTPEMYISVSEARARSATVNQNPAVPTMNQLMKRAQSEGHDKLQEIANKYGRKITTFLEDLEEKEELRLKKLEEEVEEAKLMVSRGSRTITEKEAEVASGTQISKEFLAQRGEDVIEGIPPHVVQNKVDFEESPTDSKQETAKDKETYQPTQRIGYFGQDGAKKMNEPVA